MLVAGLMLCTAFTALSASAKSDPPWANDPVVVEALKAVERIDAAVLAQDAEGFAALLASDLVVNSPRNAISLGEQTLGGFRAGTINYSAYERKIEFAGVRGDGVVVMGEEIVKPIGNAPHAGKTVRRRFTDIWRKEDGAWKLSVRQATIISIE
jgi:ketosteroid isomerase-like protein